MSDNIPTFEEFMAQKKNEPKVVEEHDDSYYINYLKENGYDPSQPLTDELKKAIDESIKINSLVDKIDKRIEELKEEESK